MQFLRFAWWNVESLAHFDAARASMERWPGSQAESEVHLNHIANGLRELRRLAAPDFIGLAEITRAAAVALRDSVFPGFGVESLDQVKYLRDRGIVLAQGYLFARPLPGRQFRELLEAAHPLGAAEAEFAAIAAAFMAPRSAA